MTTVPRTAGYDPSGSPTTCNAMQTIAYFDGLGRPLQTVEVKGSPDATKDIVQPFAYDQYGREVQKFLPYPTASADGSYKSDALNSTSGVSKFYNPDGLQSGLQNSNGVATIPNPYAETSFEPSPLNRPVEQGAPGTDWQIGNNHTVKTIYATNDGTTYSAKQFGVTVNPDGTTALLDQGNYAANQLYVTVTEDENWTAGQSNAKLNTTEEYKDKEGHVVLKRTYNLNKADPNNPVFETLSTYYVYDDFGNLTYVLPPGANPDGGLSSASNQPTLDNLCYQYNYDTRNRLSAKRIPGKAWEYMVYNVLDQVVATQDGNQRASNQWVFSKYDGQGRVIETGIWTDGNTPISRSALQAAVNSQTNLWESRTAGSYYTTNAWPATWDQTLTINYYDDYTYPDKPSAYSLPSNALSSPAGMLTGTKTLVLNTAGQMLWTVPCYDGLGRPMKTYKQHYLGGTLDNNNYDEITNVYDFTNAVTSSNRQHHTAAIQGGVAVTVLDSVTYNHMGRSIQTLQSINGASLVMLSKQDYNDIGQLKTKHLHSTDNGNSFLQDIAYTYNERGWLFSSSAQLFEEQLSYNSVSPVSRISVTPMPQYNGNIAIQSWGTASSPNSSSYVYSYDNLNRLIDGTSTGNYNEKNISYDLAGNIKTVNRYWNNTFIDDLAYNYIDNQGNAINQLQSVNDQSADAGGQGYKSGNWTYAYDANGNMVTDNSKGITGNNGIVYNLLNLPQSVTLPTGTLSYTYDASGDKLRKVSTIGSGSTVDYISGIQYKTGGAIDFIQTAEGRAINNGGSYTYEYHLTDHLGNSRVSFDQNSGTVPRQQDDYYPFGMEISSGAVSSPKNEYLYNKKELQEELGQYDYAARFYDPVIGRWTTPDPLGEKFINLTPYNYAINNPIAFIDPQGMAAEYSWKDNKYYNNGKEVTFEEAMGSYNLNVDGTEKVVEPPINLFIGLENPGSNFMQTAENYPYTRGDGMFYVFGHANTAYMEYKVGDKSDYTRTPEQLNALLAERSPEYKQAMAQRKKITIIFYACQVGATEVVSQDGKRLESRTPLAQKLTELYPNMTVIAANGYVIFGRDRNGKAMVTGIQAAEGDGAWVTYRGGKIVNTEKFVLHKEPSVAKDIPQLHK
jgi:RHS repeat-associated protein